MEEPRYNRTKFAIEKAIKVAQRDITDNDQIRIKVINTLFSAEQLIIDN